MSIADNKKAFHDFFIEEQYEAGIVLQGWEVKAIRAWSRTVKRSLCDYQKRWKFISFGAHIGALPTASTHIHPDSVRTRKLLLHAEEIKKLIGKVERSGYTMVPLNMHYLNGRVKCQNRFGQR